MCSSVRLFLFIFSSLLPALVGSSVSVLHNGGVCSSSGFGTEGSLVLLQDYRTVSLWEWTHGSFQWWMHSEDYITQHILMLLVYSISSLPRAHKNCVHIMVEHWSEGPRCRWGQRWRMFRTCFVVGAVFTLPRLNAGAAVRHYSLLTGCGGVERSHSLTMAAAILPLAMWLGFSI